MTSKLVISGDLSFLGLGDVLQLVGSNGSTGTLRIISKYSPEPGEIYFDRGNIVNAAAPSMNGLEAAYALFGWQEGTFEFHEGPVKIKKNITTSRMEIILDGLRMVDDGITQKIGPVSLDKKQSGIPVIKGPLPDYMYILDEENFDEGSVIVQENKYGNWIWVVMSGVVDIVKETPQGPLTLIRLGEGAFIGSISTFSFEGNIWTITAQAGTDVQVGVVDVQRLTEEVERCSVDFRDMVQTLTRRRSSVFEKSAAAWLGQDLSKTYIKDKKRLVRQGEKMDHLLRIRQGEAGIIRKTPHGHILLATLGQGDFIGTFPFLDIGHEPEKGSVFVTENFEADPVDTNRLQAEYEHSSYALRTLIEGIATSVSITTRLMTDFHHKKSPKKIS